MWKGLRPRGRSLTLQPLQRFAHGVRLLCRKGDCAAAAERAYGGRHTIRITAAMQSVSRSPHLLTVGRIALTARRYHFSFQSFLRLPLNVYLCGA